jgi:hypothetical protein
MVADGHHSETMDWPRSTAQKSMFCTYYRDHASDKGVVEAVDVSCGRVSRAGTARESKFFHR